MKYFLLFALLCGTAFAETIKDEIERIDAEQKAEIALAQDAAKKILELRNKPYNEDALKAEADNQLNIMRYYKKIHRAYRPEDFVQVKEDKDTPSRVAPQALKSREGEPSPESETVKMLYASGLKYGELGWDISFKHYLRLQRFILHFCLEKDYAYPLPPEHKRELPGFNDRGRGGDGNPVDPTLPPEAEPNEDALRAALKERGVKYVKTKPFPQPTNTQDSSRSTGKEDLAPTKPPKPPK